MAQAVHYLYKKRIINHGWNDGHEETNDLDLLLTLSNDLDKLLYQQARYEFTYYKYLDRFVILDESQKNQITSFFGAGGNTDLSDALERMSFEEYKKLSPLLQIELTTIKSCEPNPAAFYPMLNHSLLNSLGFKTMHHMDLEDVVDNLVSTNADEAFEKGLFFLLLNNFIYDFIGDPESTNKVSEFLDRFQHSRKKMLDHFGMPENRSLLSKHDCLKFWLTPPNLYQRDAVALRNFSNHKHELLEHNLDHFNELVSYFKDHKEKIIYIVNSCS